MRQLSLNARRAQDAEATHEIEVVLFEVTHPELEKPIRLSTDNAERISTDPLMYGTRSTWRGADPVTDPYLFIIADAKVPDDVQDAPAETQIILQALDAQYAQIMRSFTTPATISMALVLASSPNDLEGEWLGMKLGVAEWAEGEITLTLSREDFDLEFFPSGRMTRSKFPGLHL